MIKKTHLTSH